MEESSLAVEAEFRFDDHYLKVIQSLQAVVSNRMDQVFPVQWQGNNACSQ